MGITQIDGCRTIRDSCDLTFEQIVLTDESGGKLQICGLSTDIRKLFELTNMDSLLDINAKDKPKKAKKDAKKHVFYLKNS